MVADAAVLPPRDPAVGAWEETPDREWQARRMEVYAAMVTAMDRAVGRVIAAIESAAALDDTLVIFLSDNGACGEEFRGLYALAPLVVKIPQQTADGRAVQLRRSPRRHARTRPTRSAPMGAGGPISPTRRCDATSTGRTKAGSRSRSSCTGRPSLRRAPARS